MQTNYICSIIDAYNHACANLYSTRRKAKRFRFWMCTFALLSFIELITIILMIGG